MQIKSPLYFTILETDFLVNTFGALGNSEIVIFYQDFQRFKIAKSFSIQLGLIL